MNPNIQEPEIEPDGSDLDEVETAWAAERRRYLRTILSRAAGTYLVLFIGLGLLMSTLGVNPLTNNGLMPKLLFAFVALAVVAALAGSLSDLIRQQGRGWLKVAHRVKDTPTQKSGD